MPLLLFNVVENEAHIVLECPLYNSIRHKFQLLNVVLGSLGSFFQLDHQVDISLYLKEAIALYHSRELAGLTSSSCNLCPISLLAPKISKAFSFHYQNKNSLVH